IINSVDLNRLITWINAGELDAIADYLAGEIERLARAGADFGALAANTPHIVFDQIRERVSLPLISIVEATCDNVRALGLQRSALFGTRFTMQGRFYPDVFARAGLTLIMPSEEEQKLIHEKYFGELLNNIFSPETRIQLLEIVDRMKQRDEIDGVILAGTELPLLLRDSEPKRIPLLDTTKIHVEKIVERLLS
ncbi:MAG TPA: amino acid racemase, partial [Pyrinomonadaceae bacterium]